MVTGLIVIPDFDNAAFFKRLPSRQNKLRIYPDAIHILEFSREREAFFADLAQWIREFD